MMILTRLLIAAMVPTKMRNILNFMRPIIHSGLQIFHAVFMKYHGGDSFLNKILSFADRILSTEAFFENGIPSFLIGIPSALDFFCKLWRTFCSL